MNTATAESPNETTDLRQQVQDLEKALEVQVATQAGANATQAATHAGTWATMLAGGAGLVVGMFLALALTATRRS
jgi:cell division protein FtsX